jgi:hypothetical protein
VRARAAAAEPDVFHRNIHLFEDFKGVAQRKSHAFENGPDDMRACVAGCQSDERGARVRVKMRRALAHQVRSP